MTRAAVVIASAWLLASACSREPSAGPAPGAAMKAPSALAQTTASVFRDVAEETGLRFRHDPRLSGEFFLPEIMGSGVAVFDYDSDGDLDVFLVQPGTGGRLFRNDIVPDGRLRFTDVTKASRIEFAGYGMGVAAGDYDNDHHVDLYVTAIGSNALLHNNGDGTFRNVTRESGTDETRWSASAMFFDYDRDGLLDLFVTNYVDFTELSNKPCFSTARERDYCSPKVYSPVPDRLWKNVGNGRFVDVTREAGLLEADGPGLGVAAIDANGDGYLDIYVANDGAPNQLWINRGGTRFEEAGLISGTAVDAEGRAHAGMGIAAGDFDRDGDEDIFVTNLAHEYNTLYEHTHDGYFQDSTQRSQLGRLTSRTTGFGTQWFDYDNDGLLDLFVANGAVTIDEARRGESAYPYEQRNQLFRNLLDSGEPRFAEVSGGALDALNVGRGAAFGDIDNDGDVDIVVSNNNGKALLLLNEQRSGNHWLKLRLAAAEGNHSGLGARIGVHLSTGAVLWRRVGTDGSYLSANASDAHFGLGTDRGPLEVDVQWPDGRQETWKRVAVDRLVTLERGRGDRR